MVRKKIPLPVSDRRRKKHLARRDEMVDVAMGIVLKSGIDALTIKRLADQLDAAVGAIYRYFPGKADLIAGLQRRAIDSFHETLKSDLEAYERTAPSDEKVRALGRIITVCDTYLSSRHRFPERHNLMDTVISRPEMLLDDEVALEIMGTSQGDLFTTVGKCFHDATDAGALREGDVAVRTHLVWATVHGLDHFQKRDRIQPPELQVASLKKHAMRSLLLAFGGDPEDVDNALA